MAKRFFPAVVPKLGQAVRVTRRLTITEAIVQGRRVCYHEDGKPECYIIFLPDSVAIKAFHFSCRTQKWHADTIDGFSEVSIEVID